MKLADYGIDYLHQTVCAEHRDQGFVCWAANKAYLIHVRLLVALIRIGRAR